MLNFYSTSTSMLRLAMVLAGAYLASCTMITSDDVGSFKTSVDAANVQLDTSMADIDTLARDDEINLAATRTTLNETSVSIPVPPDVIAAWDSAFSSTNQYATKLQEL